MNALLVLTLAIVALVFGIVAVIEGQGRAWAGWGVVALAVIEIAAHVGAA